MIRLVKIIEQYIYCFSDLRVLKFLNRNEDLIQILGDCTEYKLVEVIRDISVFFHISDIVYFIFSLQANGSITILVVLSLVFLWALAQFGRAPDLGSGGRVFKSLMPNYRILRNTKQERSEIFTLLLISKSEAKDLHKLYGIPYGYEGISHTVSNARTYYLCESTPNKKCLKEYRNGKIVK